MNYELWKELEAAGFPPTGQFIHDHTVDPPQHWHRPSLSALIEAFGSRFSCVHRQPDGTWRSGLIDEQDKYICGQGSTPEEAVARLWLALYAHADGAAA